MPYDPAIPLLGICPEKTLIWKDICTPMFTAALFAISKTWKQPNKSPSTEKWIVQCLVSVYLSLVKIKYSVCVWKKKKENYKTSLKEIKEYLNTWKHIPGFWIRRLNIVKMAMFPKSIYRFITISIRFQLAFGQKLTR